MANARLSVGRWCAALATCTLITGLALAQDKPAKPAPKPAPTPAPAPTPGPAATPEQGPPAPPPGVFGPSRPGATGAPEGAPVRAQVIVADPPIIELGEFSTSETKAGEVMLKNTGDVPVTIRSAKASCGCTTADFKRNTVLEPGDETEVTVRMRGGPTARVLNKTVTFTIDGYPQLKVPVKGKSIAYVDMTPSRVGVSDNPDGKITFTSIDEQPFKIVNVQPDGVATLPADAASVHEVEIDWDAFLDTATNSRLTFYFDHPKSSQFFTIVRLTAEQRTQLRQNAIAKGGKNSPNKPTPGKGPGPLEASSSQITPGSGNIGPATPRTVTRPLATLVRSGQVGKVRERIEGGEDVNSSDDSGNSLLAVAAKEGNVEIMALLLDNGASVDMTDRVGRTALMHAGTSKNPEAVRLLIERGSDVNIRDSFIGGALAWTCGFGTSESVQDLLDAGAQVETVGSATGYTPLIWASGFGDPNSVPLLLEAGANIEAADGIDGSTPLMHASRTGKVEAMQTLIDSGANINATNRNGQTALLSAAGHANGTPDKIEMLLANGADLNATDNSGRTALDLAKARTDTKASGVIVLLQEKSGN